MRKSYKVLNIKCEGCANSIKNALSSFFNNIEIDLTKEPRIVTVDIENSEDEEKLKAILKKLGYPLYDENLSKVEDISLKTKSYISCAIGKFTLK